MPLGLPELGTGSNYFSQYDSDIQALLSRIYDNNSNVILAKDVRDPLWSLWNNIQQVASQSLTQSALYTLGTPSTVSIGGIAKGTTFSNATLSQILDLMLLAYVPPTVSLFSPSIVDIQYGDTSPINLSYSIDLGSSILDTSYAIQFISPNSFSPISNNAVTGNNPETGTTNNFSLTYSSTINITDYSIATMSFRTDDLIVFNATCSITQKHKIYYGQISIPGGFTYSDPSSLAFVSSYLTDAVIKGLSYSELSTNVNISKIVDFNNQYFVFASPTIFGFNNPPGFFVDNIFSQDFTKVRISSTFSNEFGYQAPYDVWLSNTQFTESLLISSNNSLSISGKTQQVFVTGVGTFSFINGVFVDLII